MTGSTLFWDFFRPLAEGLTGVTTVMHSGADKLDRLLSETRSEDVYPAVFLLKPKYTLSDNGAGNYLASFDAVFYVICAGQVDDYDSQDEAYDTAERLATDLIRSIREQDGISCLLEPGVRIALEPISLLSGDASYGFEVRMRIMLYANAVVYEEPA